VLTLTERQRLIRRTAAEFARCELAPGACHDRATSRSALKLSVSVTGKGAAKLLPPCDANIRSAA
jgi:hypothetical protein